MPNKYPYQCALCGIVWHADLGEPPPIPNPPHNHTIEDWQAYFAANGLNPNSTPPIWDKIPGYDYPPPPPWLPEFGPEPTEIAAARAASTQKK
jgi:hypothetical protein